MGYGTAFLIAENVALTAAHNIYNKMEMIPINFANLVMNIHQGVGKKYKVLSMYLPTKYRQGIIDNEIKANDFAILILVADQENNYGYIPLSLEMKKNDKI